VSIADANDMTLTLAPKGRHLLDADELENLVPSKKSWLYTHLHAHHLIITVDNKQQICSMIKCLVVYIAQIYTYTVNF
jgi:hypothetical protein